MRKYAFLALLVMPIATFSMDADELPQENGERTVEEDNGFAFLPSLPIPEKDDTYSDAKQEEQQQVYRNDRSDLYVLNKLMEMTERCKRIVKGMDRKSIHYAEREMMLKVLKDKEEYLGWQSAHHLIRFVTAYYPDTSC
jgi:hypothetical protein